MTTAPEIRAPLMLLVLTRVCRSQEVGYELLKHPGACFGGRGMLSIQTHEVRMSCRHGASGGHDYEECAHHFKRRGRLDGNVFVHKLVTAANERPGWRCNCCTSAARTSWIWHDCHRAPFPRARGRSLSCSHRDSWPSDKTPSRAGRHRQSGIFLAFPPPLRTWESC